VQPGVLQCLVALEVVARVEFPHRLN
jgi:hypothetical protein